MVTYKNRGGDSGVVAFLIDGASITVEFKDGCQYVYDNTKPGSAHVAKMKELANAHEGLNSYISSTPAVRDGWRRKKKPHGSWENNPR